MKENKEAGGRSESRGQPGETAVAVARAKVSRKPEGKIPEWWHEVPAAEKAVIRDVMRSIRGLKCSRSKLVVQAARKWERGITCFIKVRLMGERPRRRSEV